jgi:hypothetical protein
MTHHPACEGTMFLFTVVGPSSGMGLQGDVIETDDATWEACQQYPSNASDYDLDMAKIALGHVLLQPGDNRHTRHIFERRLSGCVRLLVLAISSLYNAIRSSRYWG